jgi:hypothetical protein
VVNFRYGRRGTALRDGTKTPAPVSREEAVKAFERLVSSKIVGGYRYRAGSDRIAGAAPVSPPSPPPPLPPEVDTAGLDARSLAVLRRLAQGPTGASPWRLSRAVWRAGELGLKPAEPLLLRLIGTGTSTGPSPDQPMLDYCLAWALGRCGSAQSIAALNHLTSNPSHPDMVRRIASESLLLVLDEPRRAEIIQHVIEGLPEPLDELAQRGPAPAFAEKLQEHLGSGGQAEVLERLYRINNAHVRPGLLEALRTAPLEPNSFQSLRHIFKAAELRRDAEVFGLLAYRFETTRATFSNARSRYD